QRVEEFAPRINLVPGAELFDGSDIVLDIVGAQPCFQMPLGFRYHRRLEREQHESDQPGHHGGSGESRSTGFFGAETGRGGLAGLTDLGRTEAFGLGLATTGAGAGGRGVGAGFGSSAFGGAGSTTGEGGGSASGGDTGGNRLGRPTMPIARMIP